MSKIFIPDKDRRLFTLEAWMATDDPTTALSVVLFTGNNLLEIAKNDLHGYFDFEAAQYVAAEYYKGFRCPTRHEAIEMYDARFRGLDEAFEKIGGKPARTTGWTSEADPDPKYSSRNAFIYNGNSGGVVSSDKHNMLVVRPVRLFKK